MVSVISGYFSEYQEFGDVLGMKFFVIFMVVTVVIEFKGNFG